MTVQAQNIVSLGIAAVLAGIGVIMTGTPESFGLEPTAVRWLGVIVAVLSVVQTQLRQVTGARLKGEEN